MIKEQILQETNSMKGVNLLFTIQILVIAIIVYLFLTAWGEVIQRSVFSALSLNSESIYSWILIGSGSFVALIIMLYFFGIEAHDVFGISEVVDRVLTSQKEHFVEGKLVNYEPIK